MFFKSRNVEIKVDLNGKKEIRLSGYSVDDTLRILKAAEAFATNVQKQASPLKNLPPSKP